MNNKIWKIQHIHIGIRMDSPIGQEREDQKQVLSEHLNDGSAHPKLYPYRYVVLVVFILACLVNSLPIQTFASINIQLQNAYGYSPQIITFTVLLGPIMHTLMVTPCNMIIDKLGIRIGCSIGAIIIIAGSWVRVFLIPQNPAWMIIGSILCATGYIFVISSPSVFAIKWFDSSSVPQIIAATVFFNFISSGTGAAIAGIVLPESASGDQIKQFLIMQAIVITVVFLIFIVLFRQAPPTPPSKSAASSSQPTKQPYMQTLKKLFKNTSYMKSILALSFSYGIFVSFMSVLNQSLVILGFNNASKATSYTVLPAILVGIIGVVIFVSALKKTLQYKKIITYNLLGTLLTFILLSLTYCLKVQSLVAIGIVAGCIGFFAMPSPALFAAYASELTYPVAQGSATGFLFAISHTVGFVSGLIWISILDKTHQWKVYLMFGVFCLFVLVALLIHMGTQQHLNKTNFERGLLNKDAQPRQASINKQEGDNI